MSEASKMPARTPGPWSIGEKCRMIVREVPGMCDGGDYYSVAVTTAHSLLLPGEAKANAAFIVKACNQHDELKRRADIAEQMAEALRMARVRMFKGPEREAVNAALSSWEAASHTPLRARQAADTEGAK